MRLDSSGNLGLGVTPSAWNSPLKVMQIGPRLGIYDTGLTGAIVYNAYVNTSGNFVYSQNAEASLYDTSNGSHAWYTAASGTAGNTVSFTQAMTLNASGNLGIGTTSPLNKLHVQGGKLLLISDSGTFGQFQINAPAGGEATVVFSSTGSGENSGGYTNVGAIGLGAYTIARDVLVLGVGASSGTLFLKGGQVGIGTASPGYKLDVNTTGGSAATARLIGNDQSNVRLRLENIGSGGRTWEIVGGSPSVNNSNFSIRDVTGSTTPLTIDSSGNVGIGTTSPQNLLHMYGSDAYLRIQAAGGSNYSYIRLDDGSTNGYLIKNLSAGTANGALPGALYTYTDNNKAFQHIHAGTPLFTILSGGNVGIGTTTPAGKLDVVTTTAPAAVFRNTTAASYTSLRLYNDQNSSIRALEIDYMGSTYSGGERAEIFVTGAYPLLFGTNNTERMRISSDGVVTMPTQTMISARHTVTETPSAGTPLLQWIIDVNQGGGSWNAGTGVYTVPVAGRYFVTCSLLRNSGGAAGGIVLHKNGVSVTRLFYVDNSGTTGYTSASGQLIVNCGAGDTLKFLNENTVAWYGDGAGLGSFTINLLG